MPRMIGYLCLLTALLRATVRARGDLVAENLLLRQQLAVLTRPTRRRPRLRARDKLFWLLARLARRDWRRHAGGHTGDDRAVAPPGLAPVLAVAVAHADRPSTRQPRGPEADRADGARQPRVGRRTDPGRAARAR